VTLSFLKINVRLGYICGRSYSKVTIDFDKICATLQSGLSGLDSDDYLKEILDDDERKSRSISRPKKSINRRSLLHSFERPARNIDKFVSDALGVTSTHYSQDGSCDSGLDLTDSCSLSLPRKGAKGREIGANIKTVSIQSSDDDTALTNQKREKNKSSRPRAKKTQLKDLGTRLRATSLDRNRYVSNLT